MVTAGSELKTGSSSGTSTECPPEMWFSLLCIAGLVIALLSSAYSDALRRARRREDDARTSWKRAETEWRKRESESIKAAERKASAYHQQVKQTQEKVIRAQKATEGFEKRILKAEKEAALAKKDSEDFQGKLADTVSEIVRMTKESDSLQEKLNKAQKEAEESRKSANMLEQLVKSCAKVVVTSEKPKVLTENYSGREQEPMKKEPVTECETFPSGGWTKFLLVGTVAILLIWRKVAVTYWYKIQDVFSRSEKQLPR
ncbi:vicilin-like seed storage protein At2g18540 [Penaeus monodon]|uniref:vicilin-like seed storage protein At2g18540 n=1 Tax=Penaeus monodon TaxID=6687 RepID=UPI0018A6E3B2|nr:vicilin-like seed storage protein At2g18540 [Penaeus monodon]